MRRGYAQRRTTKQHKYSRSLRQHVFKKFLHFVTNNGRYSVERKIFSPTIWNNIICKNLVFWFRNHLSRSRFHFVRLSTCLCFCPPPALPPHARLYISSVPYITAFVSIFFLPSLKYSLLTAHLSR